MNAFLDFADRTAPMRARKSSTAKQDKAKARKDKEREQLSAVYRKWREDSHKALLAGPHGAAAGELLDFLRRMNPSNGKALLELITAGPWDRADADTRFEVLRQIDAAIIARREHDGLDPFDDALPGQPNNLFLLIREQLFP